MSKDHDYDHCVRVAAAVPSNMRPAALLHDHIEDGLASERELRQLYAPETVDAVVCLTRKFGEFYSDYINRIKSEEGRIGEVARTVKLADLRDNLARSDEEHASLKRRYERAIDILLS